RRDGRCGAAGLRRGRDRERLCVAGTRQPLHGSAGAARLHRVDGALDAHVDDDRRAERGGGRRARDHRCARGAHLMRAPALLLACLLAAATAAPIVAPYAPDAIDLAHLRQPPSRSHWFGTDDLGRDVLARVLYGARVSLAVGFVSAAVAGATGVAIGGAAGYA